MGYEGLVLACLENLVLHIAQAMLDGVLNMLKALFDLTLALSEGLSHLLSHELRVFGKLLPKYSMNI